MRQQPYARHCRACEQTFYPTHGEERTRTVTLPGDWPDPDEGE